MFSVDIGVVKLKVVNGFAIYIHEQGPLSFAGGVHLLGHIDSELA